MSISITKSSLIITTSCCSIKGAGAGGSTLIGAGGGGRNIVLTPILARVTGGSGTGAGAGAGCTITGGDFTDAETNGTCCPYDANEGCGKVTIVGGGGRDSMKNGT